MSPRRCFVYGFVNSYFGKGRVPARHCGRRPNYHPTAGGTSAVRSKVQAFLLGTTGSISAMSPLTEARRRHLCSRGVCVHFYVPYTVIRRRSFVSTSVSASLTFLASNSSTFNCSSPFARTTLRGFAARPHSRRCNLAAIPTQRLQFKYEATAANEAQLNPQFFTWNQTAVDSTSIRPRFRLLLTAARPRSRLQARPSRSAMTSSWLNHFGAITPSMVASAWILVV